MTALITLLSAYGICFGIMNDKATFLTDRLRALPLFVDSQGQTFFQRMFRCPYCTGFHAGWASWLIFNVRGLLNTPVDWFSVVGGLLGYAFASSAFCYALDTVIQKLEEG